MMFNCSFATKRMARLTYKNRASALTDRETYMQHRIDVQHIGWPTHGVSE